MTPDQIQQLRRQLKLTARRLADALEVEPDLIFDWEKGERFPTRRHCEAMQALRTDAPAPATVTIEPGPWAGLADPELWQIVRKLLRSPAFFDAVRRLAAEHPDPAADDD